MNCFPWFNGWARYKRANEEMDRKRRLEQCVLTMDRQEKIYEQFIQEIRSSIDTQQLKMKQLLANTTDRSLIREELRTILKNKKRAENEKARYCKTLETLQDTKSNAEAMLRNVTLMESLRDATDVMGSVRIDSEGMDNTVSELQEFQQKVDEIDQVMDSLAKSIGSASLTNLENEQELEDELEALVKGIDQLPTAPKVPPIDKNSGGNGGMALQKQQQLTEKDKSSVPLSTTPLPKKNPVERKLMTEKKD